jgi:hypothetical protein
MTFGFSNASTKSKTRTPSPKRARSKIQKAPRGPKVHTPSPTSDHDLERVPLKQHTRDNTKAKKETKGKPDKKAEKAAKAEKAEKGKNAKIVPPKDLKLPTSFRIIREKNDVESNVTPQPLNFNQHTTVKNQVNEGMTTVSRNEAVGRQARPVPQRAESMNTIVQNAGTRVQCRASHPPSRAAPPIPITSHNPQLPPSLRIMNPEAMRKSVANNDEPLAEHHLLVGQQGRSSSNINPRLSQMPDVASSNQQLITALANINWQPVLVANAVASNAPSSADRSLVNTIAESSTQVQNAEPPAHELDAVTTNVKRVPILDPHAFELYRIYQISGTIECSLSEASSPVDDEENHSWLYCWSLINAYVLGTTLHDVEFSDRCMDIMSRSIAPGVPADVDTIKHVFTAVGIPESLKRFVVDRCVGAGKKFLAGDGLEMWKLPRGFVCRALETAMRMLDEGVDGVVDACRYHMHCRPDKYYVLRDAQQRQREDRGDGIKSAVETAPSAAPSEDVESETTSPDIMPALLMAFDSIEPTSDVADVPATIGTAQSVSKQRAKLVDSSRRPKEAAQALREQHGRTRVGFKRLGNGLKQDSPTTVTPVPCHSEETQRNKDDRGVSGQAVDSIEETIPASIEPGKDCDSTLIRNEDIAPITQEPRLTPEELPAYVAAPPYHVPRPSAISGLSSISMTAVDPTNTQTVSTVSSLTTSTSSSSSSKSSLKGTRMPVVPPRPRARILQESVVSMFDVYASCVPGAYPDSQSGA